MISDVTSIPGGYVSDADIHVSDEYIGTGYGRPTDAGIAAIRTLAENEGVILDPIYTGKGMSGMLDMIANDRLDNARDVVVLHTGGAPAIHPYASFLQTSR